MSETIAEKVLARYTRCRHAAAAFFYPHQDGSTWFTHVLPWIETNDYGKLIPPDRERLPSLAMVLERAEREALSNYLSSTLVSRLRIDHPLEIRIDEILEKKSEMIRKVMGL